MVLLTLTTIPARAQSDGPVPPSHVGVIKLKLVFENLQETINSEQAIETLKKDLAAMTQDHRSQLKQLQDRITDARTRASADREAVVDELDHKTFDFQMQEQSAQLKIIRLQNSQLVNGFAQIKAAVHDMAISRGLDLVINDRGRPVPPSIGDIINPQNIGPFLMDRNVLHTTDPVDITVDVIQTINHNFKGPVAPSTLPAMPVTTMQIGSKTYQMEIAGDDASRSTGMMQREAVPPDHGMIFVFATPQELTFWMHRTRFSLDVIFTDEHGRVLSVKPMKAYDETPITSDGEAKYAIELPAGTASAVKIGDQLSIPAVVDKSLK